MIFIAKLKVSVSGARFLNMHLATLQIELHLWIGNLQLIEFPNSSFTTKCWIGITRPYVLRILNLLMGNILKLKRKRSLSNLLNIKLSGYNICSNFNPVNILMKC